MFITCLIYQHGGTFEHDIDLSGSVKRCGFLDQLYENLSKMAFFDGVKSFISSALMGNTIVLEVGLYSLQTFLVFQRVRT
jgi:hypothetical protein